MRARRCIGCRNCNNVCPQTFGMEEEWGRARVMQQGVDTESKLQEAIDTCPVSCIHWVSEPTSMMVRLPRRCLRQAAVASSKGKPARTSRAYPATRSQVAR
jgi:ferredoxin